VPGILGKQLRREMHTDLTTPVGLMHDRNVRHGGEVRILIKSIPSGALTKLRLVCDDTVAHLHHLFRATSTHGTETLASISMPTEQGFVKMEVEGGHSHNVDDNRRQIPTQGAIPLHRYGLNQADACVVLFHGCHESTWSMVGTFIHNNLLCKGSLFSNCVVSHLDGIPRTPGADSIQRILVSMLVVPRDFQG